MIIPFFKGVAIITGQDIHLLLEPGEAHSPALGRGLVFWCVHSDGHLLVLTGYKWDYIFHKWGYKYL